ncbi:hypothetical protein NKR23_g8987 [Pleurostoma richardsiae]|uniref:C2H2-type domain-containing protein n=1 Tax=Pleurostoma richardsiae TaxID=41990 RepID=A0AA38VCH5_9PEZI|nr:hypothetical protein NKR23_g8987 [Pleurostoma richardsiae]
MDDFSSKPHPAAFTVSVGGKPFTIHTDVLDKSSPLRTSRRELEETFLPHYSPEAFGHVQKYLYRGVFQPSLVPLEIIAEIVFLALALRLWDLASEGFVLALEHMPAVALQLANNLAEGLRQKLLGALTAVYPVDGRFEVFWDAAAPGDRPFLLEWARDWSRQQEKPTFTAYWASVRADIRSEFLIQGSSGPAGLLAGQIGARQEEEREAEEPCQDVDPRPPPAPDEPGSIAPGSPQRRRSTRIMRKPSQYQSDERLSARQAQHAIHKTSPARDKPFSCSVCGRGFNFSSNRNKHEMAHDGKKRFSCSICGKAYIYNASRSRHEKTHKGKQPSLCVFCGKSFARKDNRDVHTREEDTDAVV